MQRYHSKNGNIEYDIIRSGRRTLEISVKEGTVLVRCPRSMLLGEVEAFVEQRSGWIARHRSAQLNAAHSVREYRPGGIFPLLGSEYPLRLARHEGFDGESICVAADDNTPQAVREALSGFYSRFARRYIPPRAAHYAGVLGIAVKDIEGVRLREYKSQWGSCSPANRLSFNTRLVLYTERVVDYVVVHELSHMLHRNHSPAFWAVVQGVLPDYKLLRQQLKEDIAY